MADGGSAVLIYGNCCKYDPYGKVTILAPDGVTVRATSAIGNEITYTGRRRDAETGLYYFRNRYYSGDLGRFVSRDPLEYPDGLSMYASYFAVNATDPLGLHPPSHPDCVELAGKIANAERAAGDLRRHIGNINRELTEREQEMVEDRLNLPLSHPDDIKHPELSKNGHKRLIADMLRARRQRERNLQELEQRLERMRAQYQRDCSDPEPCKRPVPVPITVRRPVPAPAPAPAPAPRSWWTELQERIEEQRIRNAELYGGTEPFTVQQPVHFFGGIPGLPPITLPTGAPVGIPVGGGAGTTILVP